ncbi:hypothetical protein M406DRAFT_261990 [Cryphonectria parasitica EP155]|uniref:DUF155 domain-containing protein n=1 Tax=Cryphonectria parasitica (strain ATCC 38755 / EP155) TaxID=660469 RepID=A0A9P4XY56_CRYP1|nr:uncharacterized protein M406DRAFT_261990 [Cryphonectria parasitica EP155]KAF3763081.1 hypothetical protein M406DRAFT_261990 [Cryphonectria parasitica EP155]
MRFPHTQVAATLCHGFHAAARSTASRPLSCSQRSLLHQTSAAFRPRQRFFFTSNLRLSKDGSGGSSRRKTARPAGAGGSGSSSHGSNSSGATKRKLRDPLRRVASLAQRSSGKPPKATRGGQGEPGKDYSTTICAICVAESFDMKAVVRSLQDQHYLIDPDGLDFDDEEVVHAGVRGGPGDFFIFETGTVVTWSLPPEKGIELATGFLASAHQNSYLTQMDRDDMTEKLEFEMDPATSWSLMRGDMVVLGTRRDEGAAADFDPTDIGRAKIAFSSGLARSTKVAVLETLLSAYLERTEELPAQLESGRLRVRMPEILQRTGELLRLRSQLNFFSELTDSLPDKFWDQRAELKLDSIYDQVGKALDVPSRIRVLNQRMDYADSMLETFREMLHSTHSARLEWIIIVLIAIEIGFELYHMWREYVTGGGSAQVKEKGEEEIKAKQATLV